MSVVLLSLSLNGVAFFYQYFLGVEPCALCVHIRSLVLLAGVLGLLGFAYRKSASKSFMALVAVYFTSFLAMERVITALLVEKGRIISSCSIDAGFPSWLPLDEWLPSFFQPGGVCGTPVSFIPGTNFISFVDVTALVLSVIYLYLAYMVISLKIKNKI